MKKIIGLFVCVFLIIGITFFFVTKEIVEDKNITIKLPPPPPPKVNPFDSGANINPRNVFNIFIDTKGTILLRDKKVALEDLKYLAKTFIMNPNQDENLAKSPKHAIISLKNEKGTPYKKYLDTYNELKRAYNELWEEAANKRFNKPYKRLNSKERKEIRNKIPLIISEAEPDEIE